MLLIVMALGCDSATGTSTAGSGDDSRDAAGSGGSGAVRGTGGNISDAEPADRRAPGGCSTGTSGVSTPRAPKQHRTAAGAPCPMERAPVTPNPVCSCADSGLCSCRACSEDSDCAAGKNGRCERGFLFQCSYDECFVDSDCAGKAPCGCRESGQSGVSNVCLTSGNCRVDGDCGPNGYCSPSALRLCGCPSTELCPDSAACFDLAGTRVPCGGCGDSCGHGYFCHTPDDTCLDDSDCCGEGSCNYDSVRHRWDCAECFLQKPEAIEPSGPHLADGLHVMAIAK